MATYVIGDIQGCFDSLRGLLAYVKFDPVSDRLWLVGDLVNRGPKSLEVLRWVRELGDSVVCVLGNHDIHLLLRYLDVVKQKKRDTLAPVLAAADCDELIDWLRHRPIMHVENGLAMVHAGLHPSWTIADASRAADEICHALRGPDWQHQIARIMTKKPPAWTAELKPTARMQAAAAVFFRMRTCREDGSMCDDFAGPMVDAPADCIPWFKVRDASWKDHEVFFGHWSALGLLQGKYVFGLDTGCVWGGALTAVRLEDRVIFQMPAAENNGGLASGL